MSANNEMQRTSNVAAEGKAIVTHNRQDFRGATRFGIPVITPADFLAWLEENA